MTEDEAKKIGTKSALQAIYRDGLASVRKCFDQGTVYGLDELDKRSGSRYDENPDEYDKLHDAFFDGYEEELQYNTQSDCEMD